METSKMSAFHVFNAPAVTLDELLNARSLRAERQTALLSKCTDDCCLVSFTLNIPGEVKQSAILNMVFEAGLNDLRSSFEQQIEEQSVLTKMHTGSEAMLVLHGTAEETKQIALWIEQRHPLGALFDIDVLRRSGRAVSRRDLGYPARRCLLCEKEAKQCARSRAHTLEELRNKIAQMIFRYVRECWAEKISDCLLRALLYEVSVTPKPGLVDRSNNGAHHDMTFFSFLDSSVVLKRYFGEAFSIGWDDTSTDLADLFHRLHWCGICAENAMLSATNGANTHKGFIFSGIIFCAALGKCWAKDFTSLPKIPELIPICSRLGALSAEMYDAPAIGARGEAINGFPGAVNTAYPILKQLAKQKVALNDAAVVALIALLSQTKDTNMLRRGGEAQADRCRKQAASLLKSLRTTLDMTQISSLDQEYINLSLSPGGCADQLALALAILFLEQDGLLID